MVACGDIAGEFLFSNMKQIKPTFNSNINVLGSIPDYVAMINYVIAKLENRDDNNLSFRTENSVKRFIAAINLDILSFKNNKHKELFFHALSSDNLRLEQKLIILFWQLCINNNLFAEITSSYFMKCVYAGRISIHADEILSFLYELRRKNPDELKWSDGTLKIIASKYLTTMKKLGLSVGSQSKEIYYPNIGDDLFVFMVKTALTVYPDVPTEENPLFRFSFLDSNSLVNRIKSINLTPYWSLTQLGNNIKITLNNNE